MWVANIVDIVCPALTSDGKGFMPSIKSASIKEVRFRYADSDATIWALLSLWRI